MNWEKTFKSQDYGRPIYKHINLPVYITDEFDFYRCVEFNSSFYGKTASTLFNGNLRICGRTVLQLRELKSKSMVQEIIFLHFGHMTMQQVHFQHFQIKSR